MSYTVLAAQPLGVADDSGNLGFEKYVYIITDSMSLDTMNSVLS